MKALARYQVILLGEQTHIRCEQLAQGWTGLPSQILIESSSRYSADPFGNHTVTELMGHWRLFVFWLRLLF